MGEYGGVLFSVHKIRATRNFITESMVDVLFQQWQRKRTPPAPLRICMRRQDSPGQDSREEDDNYNNGLSGCCNPVFYVTSLPRATNSISDYPL